MMVLVYDVEVTSRDFNEIIEMEVAMMIRGFTARDHSERIEEPMMKGPGRGLNGNLIALSTDKLPMVQLEYELAERRDRPNTTQKL
jgi:hypothetical protein